MFETVSCTMLTGLGVVIGLSFSIPLSGALIGFGVGLIVGLAFNAVQIY